MDNIIWILLSVWIVCGFITYGLIVGYFQGKYPELAEKDLASDRVFAMIMAVLGPVGVIVHLICTNKEAFKYGFKL